MSPVYLSPSAGSAAGNPSQRDTRHRCATCGAPVVRARRARGPMPRECPRCRVAHRRERQMRAYLRSAGRIAAERGMSELERLIARAVSVADRNGKR
jgi:hypothetical protein